MKFTDSFNDLGIHVWKNFLNRRKIVKTSDELIRSHLNMVDSISINIENTENQIREWQQLQKKDPKCDYNDEIEIFQLIADFYRVNGRLVLIELDVNTAYKHIFMVKSDYEYRFFARRIYTLIYESNKGLIIPIGQFMKRLEDKVDAKIFDLYKKEHSKLCDFFRKHEDELKDIRNSNEAHKFKDFEVQLESIKSLSVARSIYLIQEFKVCLDNLTKFFMIVQGALSKNLNEIVKQKIENQRDKSICG